MDSLHLINQQILLLLFIFPAIMHSKNPCSNSTCGNSDFPVKYPFKLQTDEPPTNCYNYINMRCNDHGQFTINLPSSGDFYVSSIDYTLQKISLTDPGNCLLGRLMTTNLSVYPLDAFLYENYTYYMCPKDRLRRPFTEIGCLSNSTSATIATTVLSSMYMKQVFGCNAIVSSLIPVYWSYEYNISGNFGDLQLTWNVSGCAVCEEYGPQYSGYSKSKSAKFFENPAFISVAVLVTLFGISCIMTLVSRAASDSIVEDAAASTTESSPRATGDTHAAPLETVNGTIQNSEVKKFSEVAVSGNQGKSVSCSICLEEYCGEDMVRNLEQCGHYFHDQCIDQWLLKFNTCPVCRTSLS